MSDPMTRANAIDRLRAMRDDTGETRYLSPKDREAIRHALAMAHDVDVLRAELMRIRGVLLDYAQHAESSGWFNLADEIRRRAEDGT